jgi:lipid II:glycine glycyltransferase (peptidoglycan interpeptide bridge formation enzyme)
MYKLIPAKDSKAFVPFLAEQSTDQFLQSWDWGEFQGTVGRTVRRWFVIEETSQNIVASVQVIAMPLPAGWAYWYVPRGPVWHRDLSQNEWPNILSKIIETLRAEKINRKIIFTRFEPGWVRHDSAVSLSDLPTKVPIKVLPKNVQPDVTLVLDLSPSEDEILSHMHPKTRYNIGLAEKKRVTVRTATDNEAFESFWGLMQTMATRNQITQHSRSYYQALLKKLSASKHCPAKLHLAKHGGKILAANLMLRYDQTAVYLHGASGNEGRNLMAPHLLQWHAIKEAKTTGAQYYDFWGVTGNDDPKHAWAGITRFKKGFGGRIVAYASAADAIYQPLWYALYGLLKKFRQ